MDDWLFCGRANMPVWIAGYSVEGVIFQCGSLVILWVSLYASVDRWLFCGWANML